MKFINCIWNNMTWYLQSINASQQENHYKMKTVILNDSDNFKLNVLLTSIDWLEKSGLVVSDTINEFHVDKT